MYVTRDYVNIAYDNNVKNVTYETYYDFDFAFLLHYCGV